MLKGLLEYDLCAFYVWNKVHLCDVYYSFVCSVKTESEGLILSILGVLTSQSCPRLVLVGRPISLNKELLSHLSLYKLMCICACEGIQRCTHIHIGMCAHMLSQRKLTGSFSKLSSFNRALSFYLHGSHQAVSHPLECVYLCAGDSPSWCLCVCVCIKERAEVKHDETDIDMLTSAKQSCEKNIS